MSLTKHFLTRKPICVVIFKLPAEVAGKAKIVHLVGDFNQWNHTATRMKKSTDGSFNASIELETGKEYQFRYLIDSTYWFSDPDADKYVPTIYGDSENSVVDLR